MFPNCACGQNSYDKIRTVLGSGGKSEILRCSACGLYRWHAPVGFSFGTSPKTYRLGGHNYFDTTSEQERNWDINMLSSDYLEMARRISRLSQGTMKLLDCGCALGYLLGSIRTLKPDWELQGIEISPSYVSFTRRKGFKVYEGEILEGLAQYHSDFDIIVLTGVLEHLEDPSRVLELIRGALKVGGYIVLAVPNLQSLIDNYILRERSSLSIPGQHHWFFTMRTLTDYLRKNGFVTVECRTLSFFADRAVGMRHYIGKVANITLNMTRFGNSIFFIGRRS
jgi:2-polyprenyl-3-methyl-5-hydroxy-6-metoxy-1,4-benzoquinol methylase